MGKSRWWHVAVTATGIALTIVVLVSSLPAWRTLGALAALWAFVLACAGVATAFSPSMATMQAIAYPIVWVFTERMRVAIVANVLLALAVGVGFVISIGTSEAALVQIVATLALSLGFSMAMGLWITRIFELSHERQQLIEQLQ